VITSQRERRRVLAGLTRGHHVPWDYEPRVDASRQFVRAHADLYDLQRRARLDAAAPRPSPGDGGLSP
jgi:choline-sulfatase